MSLSLVAIVFPFAPVIDSFSGPFADRRSNPDPVASTYCKVETKHHNVTTRPG
jgi:hypothetical protein